MLRVARALTWALPLLFVLGRAPADIALSTTAALFLIRTLLTGDVNWLRQFWVQAGLVLWLYMLVNSALALDPALAFERSLPWVRFIVFAAAAQTWVLTRPQDRTMMLIGLAAAAAAAIVDTMVQLTTGTNLQGEPSPLPDRLSGPFGDDPSVGTFLAKISVPVVGVLASWALLRPRLVPIAAAALGVGLIAVTILVSGERMALLLFGFALGLLALLAPQGRRWLLGAGAGLAAVLGLILAIDGDVRRRVVGMTVAQVSDFWNSPYGHSFASGFAVWLERPWIGVGMKNYRDVCDYPDFAAVVVGECYLHPHNPYLEWMADGGVIGLAGFLVLVTAWTLVILRGLRAQRAPSVLTMAIAITPIVFLWPINASQSLFTNWNGTLFYMMLGLTLATLMPGGRTSKPTAPPDPAG